MKPHKTNLVTLGFVLGIVCATRDVAAQNDATLWENFPNVNRGVIEFYRINKSASLQGLIAHVQNCWANANNTKSQEGIAGCFSLDYSTSTFDELVSMKKKVPQTDFTKIEKTLSRVNKALRELKYDQEKRGKLISGWMIAANAMLQEYARRNGKIAPIASEAENEALFSRVRAAIGGKVKDQKLLQFQNFERLITPNMRAEPVEVVCGKVQAQNLSTKNVGVHPFVYFVGNGTSSFDSGLPADDLDAEIVRNFCVLG